MRQFETIWDKLWDIRNTSLSQMLLTNPSVSTSFFRNLFVPHICKESICLCIFKRNCLSHIFLKSPFVSPFSMISVCLNISKKIFLSQDFLNNLFVSLILIESYILIHLSQVQMSQYMLEVRLTILLSHYVLWYPFVSIFPRQSVCLRIF